MQKIYTNGKNYVIKTGVFKNIIATYQAGSNVFSEIFSGTNLNPEFIDHVEKTGKIDPLENAGFSPVFLKP